jgi:hypothetical protein
MGASGGILQKQYLGSWIQRSQRATRGIRIATECHDGPARESHQGDRPKPYPVLGWEVSLLVYTDNVQLLMD